MGNIVIILFATTFMFSCKGSGKNKNSEEVFQKEITKEDLYDCYNGFYVPNNMFILIVGNFSKEEAMIKIKPESLAKKFLEQYLNRYVQ